MNRTQSNDKKVTFTVVNRIRIREIQWTHSRKQSWWKCDTETLTCYEESCHDVEATQERDNPWKVSLSSSHITLMYSQLRSTIIRDPGRIDSCASYEDLRRSSTFCLSPNHERTGRTKTTLGRFTPVNDDGTRVPAMHTRARVTQRRVTDARLSVIDCARKVVERRRKNDHVKESRATTTTIALFYGDNSSCGLTERTTLTGGVHARRYLLRIYSRAPQETGAPTATQELWIFLFLWNIKLRYTNFSVASIIVKRIPLLLVLFNQ